MSCEIGVSDDGLRFCSLSDDRFKTSCLTVAFVMPLREETASANALLPFLLRRGGEAYSAFSSFQRRLNELYGAYVSADVTRIGEAQALVLEMTSIDDRFALEREDVTAQCAALLCDLLFLPALENGVFRTAEVEQEKRCLMERLDAEINNKRLYARHRCTQEMCRGEAYGLHRYGTAEQIAALTPEKVTAAWRRMLEEAQLRVWQQSSGTGASVEETIRARLAEAAPHRRPVTCPTVTAFPTPDPPRLVTERMSVSQAKLVIGCRVGITEPDARVPAMRLMNALLGGSPHSLLFRHVREEQSLCYYCASTYDRLKGLLLIDSGVEEEKAAQAEEEILRQLKAVCEGWFSDEELEAARRSLADQLRTLGDLQESLSGWYLGQALQTTPVSPEEAAAAVERVTREAVCAAARQVVPDTLYLLAPEQTEQGGISR